MFADFRPKLPATLRGRPFVLLGNIHPQLQLDVLSQVKAPRFVAADTMNFWISGERKKLGEVLSKIDTLMINDEELRELAEIHNIRARPRRQCSSSAPSGLIMKRGEYGAHAVRQRRRLLRARATRSKTRSIRPARATPSPARCSATWPPAARSTARACAAACGWPAPLRSFCVEGVGTAKLEEPSTAPT